MGEKSKLEEHACPICGLEHHSNWKNSIVLKKCKVCKTMKRTISGVCDDCIGQLKQTSTDKKVAIFLVLLFVLLLILT